MAELIGAIASGITIAALLKTCLDAFELFEVAKNTDTDLQCLIIRLTMEKCRLYTWGQAMGLVTPPATGQERPLDSSPFQNLARAALEQILRLLNDSARIQSRYGCETVLVPARDDSIGPLADLAASFDHFTVLGQSRQPPFAKNRLFSKTRWAIKDRKKFAELIIEVRSFVDGLQEITKSVFTVARQEGMLRFGIQQIISLDTLEIVAEACQNDYPDISDAVSIKMDVMTIGTSRKREIKDWADCVDFDDIESSPIQPGENSEEDHVKLSTSPSMLPPDMLMELSRESRRMATELELAREEHAKIQKENARVRKEKLDMEQELESLTSALFQEANSMVGEARRQKEELEKKNVQLVQTLASLELNGHNLGAFGSQRGI